MKIGFLCLFVVGATLAFGQSIPTGLGRSGITCLDKDGDGYGVGPGCQGPDADDFDITVQTGPQAITKWGTLSAFLAHRGYNPLRIWYIDILNGVDATCKAANAPVGIGSPCQHYSAIVSSLVPGDMAIWRAGTYAENIQVVPGTVGSTVTYLSYPGEAVAFSGSGHSFDGLAKSYYTVDGFKFPGTAIGVGCIQGGAGDAPGAAFQGVTFRNLETSGCTDGLTGFQNLQNFTIEDIVTHDNVEHGIYIGSRNVPGSNVTVQRIISYQNGTSGMQFNGRVNNLVMKQTLVYNNIVTGWSWENGVSNSRLESGIAFGNGQIAGLQIVNNDGNCYVTPTTGVCPYDQTGNVIENITVYGTGKAYTGASAITQAAIFVENGSTGCPVPVGGCTPAWQGNLGGNTFRNIIATNYGSGNANNTYPPIVFPGCQSGTGTSNNTSQSSCVFDPSSPYLSTSTFQNIVAFQNNGLGGNGVFGRGLGNSSGWGNFTCAQAAALTTLTGCQLADPKFISASLTFYNLPASMNLHIQYSSPATHNGTITGLPQYDAIGNAFGVRAPSVGGYEYTSTYQQGWTDLPGTQLQSACPGNGFNFTNGVGPGVPPGTYPAVVNPSLIGGLAISQTNYSFFSLCYNVIANESGAAFDTTRNRMIIWGGGHGGTSGDEIYSLNLNANPPTLTRVKDPSVFDNIQTAGFSLIGPFTDLAINGADSTLVCAGTWSGNTCAPASHAFTGSDVFANFKVTAGTGFTQSTTRMIVSVSGGAAKLDASAGTAGSTGGFWQMTGQEKYPSDGNPIPRHTGGGLAYSPTLDKVLAWEGPSVGGVAMRHTWLLDMPTLAWTDKTPTSLAGGGLDVTLGGSSNDGAQCAWDSNTGKFFCQWGSDLIFLSYDPAANKWMKLINNNDCQGFATCLSAAAGTAAIDTARKLFFYIGNSNNAAPGTPIIWKVDISGSTFNMVDMTPAATGCGTIAPNVAGSAAGGISPGVVYDPVIDRIVIYPNDGNSVYLYNPDTNSCTTQTFAAGPPASGLVQPNGTYGRFAYSPQLDAFALVNKASNDAYVLNLNLPSGSGVLAIAPSTLPAIDVGSTYGQSIASWASGGTTPYTWSLVSPGSGPFPAGLSINSSGWISGTVTGATGIFTPTVKVTDSAGAATTTTLSITVNPAPTITTTSPLPNGTQSISYNQTLAVAGGTSPFTWSILAGSLTPGLTLSSGGTVSGIPAQAGNFGFTIQVTDGSSISVSRFYTLTVAPGRASASGFVRTSGKTALK